METRLKRTTKALFSPSPHGTKDLKTKGYPNMTPQKILGELKPMWIALEDANLIQPGMKYQAFRQIAEAKAMEYMDVEDMVDLLMRGLR